MEKGGTDSDFSPSVVPWHVGQTAQGSGHTEEEQKEGGKECRLCSLYAQPMFKAVLVLGGVRHMGLFVDSLEDLCLNPGTLMLLS